MPADDRLDLENAAPHRTVRSDDAPSPGPVSGPARALPDLTRTMIAVLRAAVRTMIVLSRAGARTALAGLRTGVPAVLAGLRALRVSARRGAALAVLRTRELGVRRAAALAVRHTAALVVRRARQVAAGPWTDLTGVRGPARLAMTAGVLSCLGLVAVVNAGSQPAQPEVPATAASDQVAVAQDDDRSGGARVDSDRSTDKPADKPTDRPGDRRSDRGDRRSAPVDPDPVAGLSRVQMDNAKAIVRTGRDMGMPRRALIIGVATAIQESNLLNRASEVLPESKNYPHQGTGWDHDSVGLFQQRTSSGWGPVHRLMDPAYATAQFFDALRRVPGWERMRLSDAAQSVQVSAFPDYYGRHEGQATEVVDAIEPALRH